MSVAFVNQAVFNADTNATTIPAAAASHTAGNALVVGVVWGNAGINVSSIADTALNSFVSTGIKVTSGTDFIEIWIAKNITGNAANVVTANFSGNAAFRRICVLQYSGVDLWNPVDIGGTNTNAAGTAVTATATGTTKTGDDLQVSFACASAAETWACTGHSMRSTALGADTGAGDRIFSTTQTNPTAAFTCGVSARIYCATVLLRASVHNTILEDWASGTRDTVKWPTVVGTGSVISNKYALSGTSAKVEAAAKYMFKDTFAMAQLDVTGMTGTIAARMLAYTDLAANNYFQIFLNGTNWFASERQAGVVVGVEDTGTWTPATDQWWRIIHTTGTGVQFQNSTDGTTWTTLKTIASPTISLTGSAGALNFSTSSANTATGNYLIDNINIVPAGAVTSRPGAMRRAGRNNPRRAGAAFR